MADETLNIRITADTKNAEGALGGLRGALGGIGDILKTGVGVALGGFINEGIGALVGGLGDVIQSARDSENANAQLNAVLQSTGGIAGVTADMANELASAFQKTTKFSDETTLAGENMLLTFTNIGKDVFPQATEAMLNLAEKMHTDPEQAAIQLGKALNDPAQGLTALSRVGVSFTEEQKSTIESLMGSNEQLQKLAKNADKAKEALPGLGRDLSVATLKLQEMEKGGKASGSALEAQKNKIADIQEKMASGQRAIEGYNKAQAAQSNGLDKNQRLMEAQKIILGELGREFDGVAEAAGSTSEGKMTIFANKIDDIKEKIGGAFLPILDAGTEALSSMLDNPAIQAGIDGLVSGLGELSTNITSFFQSIQGESAGGIVSILLGTLGVSGDISAQVGNTVDEIISTVKTLWDDAVNTLQTGGSAGGLLSVLLGDLGVNSGIAGKVGVALNQVIGVVQSAAQGLIDWVTGSLAPALASSFAQISAAAGPTLLMLGEWLNTTLLPAFQQLVNWIGPVLSQAFTQLGEFILKTALPALTQLGVWIFTTGLPAIGQFAMWVGGVLNDAFRSAGQLWTILVIGFQKAGTFIEGAKQGLMDLAAALIGPVADAFMWFQSNVLDPIKEALAALRMWISLTIDALNKLGAMAAGAGAANPFGGQRADGGVVNAGMTYLVGERGPELFTPRTSGMITPNGALAGAGGGTVVINYAPFISTADRSEAQERLTPLVLEILRSTK